MRRTKPADQGPEQRLADPERRERIVAGHAIVNRETALGFLKAHDRTGQG